MFSLLKKWKYVQLIFQKLTQIVKNKWFSKWYQKKKKSLILPCSKKKVFAVLKEITSKLKFHEKLCKNKDFCGIVMLKFNQYVKSDKISCIVFADLE